MTCHTILTITTKTQKYMKASLVLYRVPYPLTLTVVLCYPVLEVLLTELGFLLPPSLFCNSSRGWGRGWPVETLVASRLIHMGAGQ